MGEWIEIRKNRFELLTGKAVWWEDRKTLLISDLHIGKVSFFRKEGIAIPRNAIQDNFNRLDKLLENYQAEQIIFLGDLFHHRMNAEWDLFTSWRKKYNDIRMDIVIGNHDLIPNY